MQNIKPWQDYISSLPDEKFFYVMRLYLGEIKTPYNKLKLIEQLASLIRNKTSLERIISFLDETDVKILTAISMIPNATQRTLTSFFEPEETFPFIYSRLVNLTDRLLVYTQKNEATQEDVYKINPLVVEEITPFLNPDLILPEEEPEQTFFDTPFSLTPNFLAGLLSFIKISGCGLKANGTFKKTDAAKLEEIFGDRLNCLQLLVNAFINLEILREGEKSLEPDERHLEAFASLPENKQYAYLAVASGIRLGRENLKKQTQLLLDTLASVPESGFTKKTFLRYTYLVARSGSEGGEAKSMSRFSAMLARAKLEAEGKSGDSEHMPELMDSVFDAAVEFGLVSIKGETENGENLYVSAVCTDNVYTQDQFPKVLNINATSSVTLLPGLPLNRLLPFTEFLQPVHCSTVSEFEITKKSVCRAFDKGYSLERIKEILSENASFELPQNLIFNLDEWHNSYSSVIMYKGFVLKVSREQIAVTEKNPNVARYIREKLAEGIYLLDLPFDSDPVQFIKDSGLDVMGSVRTVKKELDFTSLPHVSDGARICLKNSQAEYRQIDVKKTVASEKDLLGKLEASGLDDMQKESLQMRIENHLIISETQLVSTSVRTEILEADGMDFHGKIHLTEAAIKGGDMLEISLPCADGSGNTFAIVGTPLQLIKHEGEAVLRFNIEPDGEQNSFLISKITHIRRIRS